MRPQILAVAFDMDGLMLNTEDLYEIVGTELMERRGKKYGENVRRKMIGLPAEHAFGVLIAEEGLKESWRDLQRETEEIFETLLEKKLNIMSGLETLLDELDGQGIPRCVATSSTKQFAIRALGLVNLLERVDFVLTTEDVTRGKPHPDIYVEAAKRMGVIESNMLVLEDSGTGTRAGVAAGAYVVSVPNKHTEHCDFAGAKLIASGLDDERLMDMLKFNTR